MRFLIILVGWVICLFLGNNVDAVVSNDLQVSSPTNLYLTEGTKEHARRAIFESYTSALADFKEPEVANIIEEFQASLYLAEIVLCPKGDGLTIRALEDAGGYKIIPVVPILPGDEKSVAFWEKIANTFKGPVFMPDPPMLILGKEKFSKFWKGISLIHQGTQIMAYVWGEFESLDDPLTYKVANEFHSNKLIFEILNQEGGEAYNKIIAEKVKVIKAHFAKNKIYLSPDFSEAEKLNNAFPEPPLSEDEIRYRWQTLWLHATFKAIEELNKKDSDKAERAKICYLEALFTE